MAILLVPVIIFVLILAETRLFAKYWSRGLGVSLTFEGGPAEEGDTVTIREVVTNRSLFLIPMLRVDFETDNGLSPLPSSGASVTVSDHTHVLEVFSIHFYERITRKMPVRCEKRGFYRIIRSTQNAVDLFGRTVTDLELPQQTHLYVYPRLLSASLTELPFARLLGEAQTRRRLFEDPFLTRGVRPYTPDDPERSINWKASAHTGALSVNEHDFTAGQSVLFLLNLEDPAVLFPAIVIETAIRLVRTFAAALLARGIPVCFRANGRDTLTGLPAGVPEGSGPSHLTTICEALSRIDLSQDKTSAEDLFREAAAVDPYGTTIVLVSPSQRDPVLREAAHLSDERGGLLWYLPAAPDVKLRVREPGIEVIRIDTTLVH